MPRTRTRRLLGVVLSAGLLLSACADDAATPEVDDVAGEATEPSPEPSPSPEPQPEPEPQPTETAAPSPEPAPSSCPQGQQRVAPGGSCFEPSPSPSPVPEPEPEPEPEPTQEETQDPEPEPAGPCERGARTFTIVATNFQFDPGDLGEICVGDTIVMQNEGGTHTLKDQETKRETSGTSAGESASLTVRATGEYDFFCGFHPQQMRTDVNVAG